LPQYEVPYQLPQIAAVGPGHTSSRAALAACSFSRVPRRLTWFVLEEDAELGLQVLFALDA